jgi:hypothetical protein
MKQKPKIGDRVKVLASGSGIQAYDIGFVVEPLEHQKEDLKSLSTSGVLVYVEKRTSCSCWAPYVYFHYDNLEVVEPVLNDSYSIF